jgi:hypothetical protein
MRGTRYPTPEGSVKAKPSDTSLRAIANLKCR